MTLLPTLECSNTRDFVDSGSRVAALRVPAISHRTTFVPSGNLHLLLQEEPTRMVVTHDRRQPIRPMPQACTLSILYLPDTHEVKTGSKRLFC